ncbi:TPA: hypothetical protein N0F65_010093 [Lagenidium giganteum]|uniref:NADH dehydrogenase [ubiquinone] 1 alpha subcomplex subunit 12 n=1 Tax=Lagenidium giganteum TaxID=4803 RepID=A0AAV2YLT3_9STRA|nr:TPA: hypothetical protein N0F65_010093 [Lagenidium giganteum]
MSMTGMQAGKRAAAIAGGRLVKKNAALNVTGVQQRTLYAVYEKYMEAYKRYGWKQTLWKLYNPGDVKFGKHVGTDEFGFKYYEDPTELWGQQRWTEYKVDTFDDFEGSMIPPQWHLWLQQITDAKPGEPGQNPDNWPKVPISKVSDAPYSNHVGPSKPYKMNMTLARSRGYGVGSIQTKPDEPDQFYIQRNHALRTRKRNQDLFDDIDYNNPSAPPKYSSEPLRPSNLN